MPSTPPASTPHVLSVPPPPVQPRAAACPQSLYSFNAPPSLFRSRPVRLCYPQGVPCLVDILLPSSFDTDLEGRPDRRDSSLNKFASPAVLQVQSSGQIESIRSGLASHRDLLAGFECWYPLFLSVSKSSSHNRFTSPFMLLSESMALLVVVLGSLFVNYTNSASKPSLSC